MKGHRNSQARQLSRFGLDLANLAGMFFQPMKVLLKVFSISFKFHSTCCVLVAIQIFKEIFPCCTFGLVILPQSPSQLDEPEVLHLRSCSSWKKDHYPIMQCFGWPSQFREKRGKQCTIPRERSIIRSSCSIWANPHKKWENCMDWAIPNPERKNVIPWCSIWVNPHNRAKKGGNYREELNKEKIYDPDKTTFFYPAVFW